MASIYKTLALVFIGILIAAFGVWKWVQKSKDFVPIAPTNIFKSIEYVEELRLTTYFFEELLILGTPENVKQLRDDLLKELEALQDEERRRAFVVQQAEDSLKQLTSTIFSENPELSKLTQKAEELENLYKSINRTDRRLIRLLRENDGIFGPDVKKEFEQYVQVEKKIDETRGNTQAQWRNNLEVVKNNLFRVIETERKLRWNTWKIAQAEVDRLDDKDSGKQKNVKAKKREAEKALKKAEKELEDIQDDISKKKTELERAEKELEEVIKTQGDTLKPKLMIIAKAQISGYVNLKDLKINQRQFDDTLEVYVPRPQLDSVIVMIDDDSTDLYPLAKAELGKTSEEGGYYDIFQQLKNAIVIAEGQVKKRAIEAGIMAETSRLAKEYVMQFASNLNLPVVFRDSIPQLKVLPKLPQLPPIGKRDSLSKDFINSLKSLDSAEIEERKESLQDSALLEMDIQ